MKKINLSKFVLTVLFLLIVTVPVYACIWDYDTLAMERSRFPSVLELITGKFNRHSEEFYLWRIEDRLGKLKAAPNDLALYDDLAVAYDKIGEHQKAIETILKKNGIKPGLYETEANLGTFLIHSGQFEEGLEHIEKAIEINPDAHFGREEYQMYLVKYLLDKKSNPEKYKKGHHSNNFRIFLFETKNIDFQEPDKEIKKAVHGVLGMMRFGNFQSPILLEVLGDLLFIYRDEFDSKRLAARAYLKASFHVENRKEKRRLRDLASYAIQFQAEPPKSREPNSFSSTRDSVSIVKLKASLESEIKEAQTWFEQIRNDEIQWIESKKDVDKEYAKKYYSDPVVSVVAEYIPQSQEKRLLNSMLFMLPAFILACLVIFKVVLLIRRRVKKQ